jgi:uridine kinase
MIQYVKSSIFSAEGQHMNDIMAIGIAGGTGSGKTTITRLLSERFGKDVSVIYYDNYYKAHDDLTYDERAKINYDCPDAFDTELFLEDVAKLKRGEDVLCPVYDYTVHNRSNQTLLIKSAPVILLEGILLLSDERIRNLLDIKIFVDTDADVRILRRIMRDVKERKRSLESVVEQYLTTVKPMHEMYVEPSKRYANIIIPEGGHNMVAVNMLMERINAHINA